MAVFHLGWPQECRGQTLLSGDVLVTGFDIIFWVARMMMMSIWRG